MYALSIDLFDVIFLHQVRPLCLHAQQIKLEKRLKRIIKTFENDQKDSAEASVAGSVVELKAWQQAKAFEVQNLQFFGFGFLES